MSENAGKSPAIIEKTVGSDGQPKPSHVGIHDEHDEARHSKKESKQEELDIFQVDEKKPEKCVLGAKILDNNYLSTFITLLTVYALFGDDIRIMAFTLSADIYFNVITIISMFFFAFEVVLSVLAKYNYTWSFFFWLDVISTISLLLDITWISTVLFSTQTSAISDTTSIARGGKAARVGTKAGRIVRLVRLIRLVKLYKAVDEKKTDTVKDKYLQKKYQKLAKVHAKHDAEHKKDKKEGDKEASSSPVKEKTSPNKKPETLNGSGDNQAKNNTLAIPREEGKKKLSVVGDQVEVKDPDMPQDKESRVSKRLSELTTKRVIIIVLLLLLIMPFFSADYFFTPVSSIQFAVSEMAVISYEAKATPTVIQNMFESIQAQHQDLDTPVAYLSVPFDSIPDFIQDEYDELRNTELDTEDFGINWTSFSATHSDDPGVWQTDYDSLAASCDCDGCVSTDEDTEGQCLSRTFKGELNLRKTQIITAGLSFGRTFFVCIVLSLGALMFSKDANDLALAPIERMIEKVNRIAKNPISAKTQKLEDGGDNQYETVIIENAIIKIGTLLALGFGDAGSEIIGSNMAKSGDVDPMIPGKKKCAIYGFCDIRNFTDATEVLQEDVMVFVNTIGEIVHSMVDRYQGAANKNIGDAFLLVWKINDDMYSINDETNEITYHDLTYIAIMGDFAVIAFMKVQAKLFREPKILAYREDQRLCDRMPNYKIKMGFGLHIGWGIEGAIGSEFKIDASYLSPNVNMSSRLEAATKQFGVPLLVSSKLVDLLSPSMKRYTRQIDQCAVKGSNKPIGFFTVDMDYENLPRSKGEDAYNFTRQELTELQREKKNFIASHLLENEFEADLHIETNKDLRLITQNRDDNFQRKFAEGFEKYIHGQWNEAKELIQESMTMKKDDGPSMTLLEVMKEYNYTAPDDWKGFRSLTEK